MSHHIITISSIGCKLKIDRGLLVISFPKETYTPEGNLLESTGIPFEEIRMVVLATPAVSITGVAITHLVEANAAILHCNKKHQPVAWTLPTFQSKRYTLIHAQLQLTDATRQALWHRIVQCKVYNQIEVLKRLGLDAGAAELQAIMERPQLDEANAARCYWKHFYGSLAHLNVTKRHKQGAEDVVNARLNYGYAILKTLIHRACLISGLMPFLGLHHQVSYKGQPLVYDVVEPYRPYVDYALWHHVIQASVEELAEEATWKNWYKEAMQVLQTVRLTDEAGKPQKKLVDVVELNISSLGRCMEQHSVTGLILPDMRYAHF
ncbi:MAG: type II CRISPR-associated endonuclease Cas1 [Vampirovibrio sp.]|nr:type II CRISPR-associated endonuclease Cas1 [Vampirovibrio sp.]